jgi:hypothetical protein
MLRFLRALTGTVPVHAYLGAMFVGVSAALLPTPASALMVCLGPGNCMCCFTGSMEDCNARNNGNGWTCFPSALRPGDNILVRHANGQATLVLDGVKHPMVVPAGESGKVVSALFGKERTGRVSPEIARTALDTALKLGSRKVDDATARTIAKEYMARIVIEKR